MLPQTPQTDERHAAISKLINVWSSLAEKYSKPLEEDDIVDILTGEVVKDRGVISSWDRSKQGFFTGDRSRSRRVECDFLHAKEDQDLKEFMEAEKQRKELYGDDDSSDSDLEQLQSELHQFQRSEDEVSYPPPSSSPLSSPMVSRSSSRVSLSPLRALSSGRASVSSSSRISLSPLRALSSGRASVSSSSRVSLSPLRALSSGRASVSSVHDSSPPFRTSVQSSPPCLPLSPPVRSASCFISFDSDSEDELLGVWAQLEEVSKESPRRQSPTIQEIPFKTPSPKLKRTSKRKRVVTSSDEESRAATHAGYGSRK